MTLIFISHASQDIEIAEHFVDSLKLLGVDDSHIFFSAKAHLGVGVGKRFTEVISQKLRESDLIFLLLTKNYYASYNCQQEEGVAWYEMNNKTIYPIRIGISIDDMKGFIDKTVIVSEPQMTNLRDIPYKLKELDFINTIPKNRDQFDIFIENCSGYTGDTVPDNMGYITPKNPDTPYLDEDLILLNYFLENNLPQIINYHRTGSNKHTIDEYASNYSEFDYVLRISYFKRRGWIVHSIDGEDYLDNELFDKINSDSSFESRIRSVSSKYKKEKESLESLILGDYLSDALVVMLTYIWNNKVIELGDRWMAKSTIDDIISWEKNNDLDHFLSDNYNKILGQMKNYRWIYVKEETSYGNPRLYGISDNLTSQLNSMSDDCVNHI